VLSNSQIGLWLRCPKAWEYRYVKGLKIPPAGVMVQGSAYHGALKENFNSMMAHRKMLSVTALQDAFSTYWDERVRGNPIDKEEDDEGVDDINWEGNDPGKLKDEGIKLARIYHSTIAEEVAPIRVEAYNEKMVGDVKYIGYIDVETLDEIIDHKLKSRSLSQMDADRDTQPLSYCMFTGKTNFTYHVAVKKKIPEIQIVHVEKTMKDIQWWEEAIKQIATQIETGIAPPNPTNWTCNPRFCGYWNRCKGQ